MKNEQINEFVKSLRIRADIRRNATGRKNPGQDRLATQLDKAADIIEKLTLELENTYNAEVRI